MRAINNYRLIILLLLFICIDHFASAQDPIAKTDSSKLYRDIETFSKKRKSTHFIYRLFFRPVPTSSKQPPKLKRKIITQRPYSAYEGRIIREIYITTLDPFGYSVNDTNVSTQNIL